MLTVHIIFLAIFIVAALVISIYGLSLNLIRSDGSVDQENLVLFTKLCIMNTLVNLVTSIFATYLLYTISVSKSATTGNSKQSIADLAWMRNQEAV